MKKKKTRNPLIRRIPRELAGDWRKYLLVSLFLILTIGFVSGMYVANESMMKAADEGVTKYKLEDGHFELNEEADQTLLAAIATGEKADVKQYYTDKARRELDEKFDDEFEDKFKDEFDSQFKEEFDRKFNAEFQTQFDQTFAAQVKQTLLAQGMDETMAAAMLDTAVAQAKQAGSYSRPTMPLTRARIRKPTIPPMTRRMGRHMTRRTRRLTTKPGTRFWMKLMKNIKRRKTNTN